MPFLVHPPIHNTCPAYFSSSALYLLFSIITVISLRENFCWICKSLWWIPKRPSIKLEQALEEKGSLTREVYPLIFWRISFSSHTGSLIFWCSGREEERKFLWRIIIWVKQHNCRRRTSSLMNWVGSLASSHFLQYRIHHRLITFNLDFVFADPSTKIFRSFVIHRIWMFTQGIVMVDV